MKSIKGGGQRNLGQIDLSGGNDRVIIAFAMHEFADRCTIEFAAVRARQIAKMFDPLTVWTPNVGPFFQGKQYALKDLVEVE